MVDAKAPTLAYELSRHQKRASAVAAPWSSPLLQRIQSERSTTPHWKQKAVSKLQRDSANVITAQRASVGTACPKISRRSHPTTGEGQDLTLHICLFSQLVSRVNLSRRNWEAQLFIMSKCVHSGCGKVFSDPNEDCLYHPGPPVFHEGQKGKLQQRPTNSNPNHLHALQDGSAASLAF